MITVGMNYQVLPGKEPVFEEAFAAVLGAMHGNPEHVCSDLYRSISGMGAYLIVSEWKTMDGFQAFVRSPEFARVATWGREQVLAARPRHHVYETRPVGGPARASGSPG